MADLAQLEAALVRAGDAGDEEAARVLAAEIKRARQQMGPTVAAAEAMRAGQAPSVMDVPLSARREAAATPAWQVPIIGAGRQADQWVEGAKQPFLVGTPAAAKQTAQMSGADATYRALQDEHPWLTLGGEAAAYMIASNPIAMAVLGAVSYGSPGERAKSAALNWAGGEIGQRLGRAIAAIKGPASMTDEAVGGGARAAAPGAAPRPSARQAAAAPGVSVAPAPVPGSSQGTRWEDFVTEPVTNGNQWGIPLTKGMAGQGRTQQIIESVLENMPGSSGTMLRAKDKAFSAFNSAVGREIGQQGARRLTPEVLGAAQRRIGGTIEDIAARNRIAFDEKLLADLEAVKRNAMENIANPNELQMVLKKIENVYAKVDPATDTIPGTLYRSLQSDFGRTGQNYGGTISSVMHDARAAMRDAMTRSVSKQDSAAWLKANEEYFNLQQVAKAAKAETDGSLSPRKLLTQVNLAQNQSKFGGGNDLAELARWASYYLPDKIPNSGTAQRLMWQKILSQPLTTAAALGGGVAGANMVMDDVPNEAYAGAAIPYIFARGMAGKPASALARALMARAGAAAGAVGAQRIAQPDEGDPRLLAAAMRRLAREGAE